MNRAAAKATTSAPPTYFHLTSYCVGLLTALLLVGGALILLRPTEPAPIVLHPPPTSAPTGTPLPTATPPPLVVFVSGAVQQPGMYTLAPAARVGDAVSAAGGMTLQANPALVNQAERLWDGAQIHIPVLASAAEDTAAAPPDDSTVTRSVFPPSALSAPGVAPPGAATTSPQTAKNANGLIRINHAAPAELESLPGIGPSKAAAIVVNRPYATIDDLEKVPGIGVKTVAQLRPLVTVE